MAALEKELADAQAAAMDDLIERARAGDEAAIRAVLDLVNTETKFVAYDYGKIARAPDLKPFLRVLDQVWPTASPIGEEQVRLDARRQRHGGGRGPAAHHSGQGNRPGRHRQRHLRPLALPVLAGEPRRGQALHASDTRSMTNPFGFYPHGWYGPDTEGGKSFSHQPLRILAKEYVAKHDPTNFATTPGELIVEPATIHCAGFVWEIKGDSNRNCTVQRRLSQGRNAGVEAGIPVAALRELGVAATRSIRSRSARSWRGAFSTWNRTPSTR